MLYVLVFEPRVVIVLYRWLCPFVHSVERKLTVMTFAVEFAAETHEREEIARGGSFQSLEVERKLTVMILDVISLDVNLCKTGVVGVQ